MSSNVTLAKIEEPDFLSLPSIHSLPKAPGNNWGDVAFKRNHSKSQMLQSELKGNIAKEYSPTYVRGAPMVLKGSEVPSSCQKLHQCLTNECQMVNVQKVPSSVVLGFKAFYKEGISESNQESERVRKVSINFYLVDNTIMISEFSYNSGLPTGVMLKRQRVKGQDGIEIGATHFNIGHNICIFGRVYHIVSCDQVTRDYLTDVLGKYVGEEIDFPDDQYANFRSEKIEPTRKPRTYEDQDLRLTLEQQTKGRVVTNYPGDVMRVKRYLQDSEKVMRFYAFWDDTDNPHGDIRLFEVRYYVQDDTIFVAEKFGPNSGRDEGSRTFCSRRRCPKLPYQGKGAALTFSHRVNGITCEYHGDEEDKVFYGLKDFNIGETINVFGREFEIYDADVCTRSFFNQNFGINLREKFDPPVRKRNVQHPTKLPKYNGFGSEEDSKASCGSLMLKAPKANTKKWMEMDGKVLRFTMSLYDPDIPEDRIRKFILSFHLADDSITVTECMVPDTGFLGGKMLHQRVKKYNGEGPQCYYCPADFRIGEPLLINGNTFVITSMDKYTEEYYSLSEKTLDVLAEIPKKNIQQLLNRLRVAVDSKFVNVTEAFRCWDRDHDGVVTLDELSHVISNLNLRCREEELVALMAQFDTNRSGSFSFQEFMNMMSRDDTAECHVVSKSLPEDGTKFMRGCHIKTEEKNRKLVRDAALKMLSEKLAERRLNGFEMFRMISTVPRGPQGPAVSYITPLQLSSAMIDILDLKLTREAEEEIIAYFFPNIPQGIGYRQLAGDKALRVDLTKFHKYIVELSNIGQLVPPKN